MSQSSKSRTRRVFGAVLAVAGVISLAFVPWNHIRALLAPLPDTVQEQVNDAVDLGLDGIIVYVDRGGNAPEYYAAGWKNRDTREPADPHALFKIASINKLYIAVAATRLANQQKLSLDDTLADHFPELVGRIEYAEAITIRQMIQHRSGIPNFIDHPDYPWDDLPKNSQEALGYALDLPADFKPGEDYSYSNTNYLLLAEAMDQILDEGLFNYIRAEVLLPLDLHRTYFSLSEVDPEQLMSGYYVDWEPDLKSSNHGSMIATAEDVGIFLRALNDGTLLSEEEQAIYSSVYVYEHTGSVPGYSSIARYHADIDTVVIQLVNTSGGKSWTMTEIVYDRLLKILRKETGAP